MLRRTFPSASVLMLMVVCFAHPTEAAVVLNGHVVDAETGILLAHRIYIRGENGKWYFPKSALPARPSSCKNSKFNIQFRNIWLVEGQ